MHPQEVWHSRSVEARLLRTALIPASFLYACGWQTYLATYRLGLKHAAEPHCPVLCIGNLQVGGSGKSPLSLYVAKRLRSLGFRVVMSLSGYGAPHSENATLAPEGRLSPAEWGDEPAMVRWLAPDLPLVVGRNRVAAATATHTADPGAVLLMDDGFQHLPLQKHGTIVLDPPSPDNRWCLPAGPYREPRSNRSRADLVIPGRFQLEAKPTRFLDGAGAEQSFGRYGLLCALGNPESFASAVEKAAGRPAEAKRFLGDHDPMTEGTLLAQFPPDLDLIVSAKDWVKLRERPDAYSRRILIASHEVFVTPQDEFDHWLKECLKR